MWITYLITFILTTAISFLWARGIDNMKEKHSDYKGEDFLNETL